MDAQVKQQTVFQKKDLMQIESAKSLVSKLQLYLSPVCYLAFEGVGFEIQHGPFPYNLGK